MTACCYCNTDLGTEVTIVALQGNLMCNLCADLMHTKAELRELGDVIVPSDIGLGVE